MKINRSLLQLSPLFAASLLAACASAPKAKPNASPSLSLNQPVHVEGVLTDNGMGCTALRTRDGSLYTFARDLEGPKKGERLWVDGYVTTGKGCRLGTNIMPERAGVIEHEVAAGIPATTGRR
jgi:hypothetical protein